MQFDPGLYAENFPGFIIDPKDRYSGEARLLREIAMFMHWDIDVANTANLASMAVPMGSVHWVREYAKRYGIEMPIDPYPEFLHHLLYRKVWFSEKWPHAERCFVKPARTEKRFTGFVKHPNSYIGKKHNESYWCSEVVEFQKEFRVYVLNSINLAGHWDPLSQIDHVNFLSVPKPLIPEFEFPHEHWCGTIDFGILKTGEVALVEAHQNPFSCGWYGKMSLHEGAVYGAWLKCSWSTLLALANKK